MRRMTPRVQPFGDAAFLVPTTGLAAARWLGRAIGDARHAGTAPAGILEVVVGFDSVVVRCDPGAVDAGLAKWLAAVASRLPGEPGRGEPERGEAGRSGPERATIGDDGRAVEIPVEFDGPDLEEVAAAVGDTSASVVELLTGTALEVALLGFAPGFPYLIGLPPALATVPRRATPRPAVPAGSVAVGGGFASVYPQSSPGGWMILGRTTTRLFDPHRPPFALLRPGDTVRFAVAAGGSLQGPGHPVAGADVAHPRSARAVWGLRVVEVVEPGLLSLVEDAGRRGVAALGVPAGGPADPESMQLANALVGNGQGAACIEVAARGPTLRFTYPAYVAVVASAADAVEVDLDGYAVGADVIVPVRPGQTLAVGRVHAGLRAYVAVAGGILTPPVVGSRSSDQLSGLGLGPLRAGDRLEIGTPGRPHGLLSRPPPAQAGPSRPVRVVLGPHPFPATATDALFATPWSVGADSNRIGLRLGGSRAIGAGRPAVTSTGMVAGAVQVPPDGDPIVLMVDHATMGGYPVIACVISVDLPRLGQARPGDRLAFAPVEPAEARRVYRRRALALAASVSGWFPTAAAT